MSGLERYNNKIQMKQHPSNTTSECDSISFQGRMRDGESCLFACRTRKSYTLPLWFWTESQTTCYDLSRKTNGGRENSSGVACLLQGFRSLGVTGTSSYKLDYRPFSKWCLRAMSDNRLTPDVQHRLRNIWSWFACVRPFRADVKWGKWNVPLRHYSMRIPIVL